MVVVTSTLAVAVEWGNILCHLCPLLCKGSHMLIMGPILETSSDNPKIDINLSSVQSVRISKIGRLCLSLGGGSPSNTKSPRPRPTSIPSGILVKGTGGFVCLLLACVIGVKTEMRVLPEKQFGFVQG